MVARTRWAWLYPLVLALGATACAERLENVEQTSQGPTASDVLAARSQAVNGRRPSFDEQRAKANARVASTGGGTAAGVSTAFGQANALRQAASRVSWGSGAGSSSVGSGGTGDQIAKLERLQKLRKSGALTDMEFEREKAKILSEN